MKYTPVRKSILNNVFDSYFDDTIVKNKEAQNTSVKYAILESEKDYLLEMDIPGYKKEDFKIDIEKNLLTVSVEAKRIIPEEYKILETNKSDKKISQTFRLTDQIDKEKISATYENGILNLRLPRIPKKETTRRIEIG